MERGSAGRRAGRNPVRLAKRWRMPAARVGLDRRGVRFVSQNPKHAGVRVMGRTRQRSVRLEILFSYMSNSGAPGHPREREGLFLFQI